MLIYTLLEKGKNGGNRLICFPRNTRSNFGLTKDIGKNGILYNRYSAIVRDSEHAVDKRVSPTRYDERRFYGTVIRERDRFPDFSHTRTST